MKPSITSPTARTKYLCTFGAILLIALACVGLFVGKYPLSLTALMRGDQMQWRVFLTLRCSRTVVGVAGGFALGVAGFVYQTVFRNPLASPDIIGVSSGASAGAAAGILFLSGAAAVTLSAFTGALLAVVAALALSSLDRSGRNSTIVLAGIAVHALAQTALMCLKLTADPERELASIEYWIMGSLNGVNAHSIAGNLLLCAVCMAVLFVLHRQLILLSTEEGEARVPADAVALPAAQPGHLLRPVHHRIDHRRHTAAQVFLQYDPFLFLAQQAALDVAPRGGIHQKRAVVAHQRAAQV